MKDFIYYNRLKLERLIISIKSVGLIFVSKKYKEIYIGFEKDKAFKRWKKRLNE